MSVIAIAAAALLSAQPAPAGTPEEAAATPRTAQGAAGAESRAPRALPAHLQRRVVQPTLFAPRAPGAPSGAPVTPATAMEAAVGATYARAMVTRLGGAQVIRNRTLDGCEAQNIGGVNADTVNGDIELVTVLRDVQIINRGCRR
jgi:hypothetical protein